MFGTEPAHPVAALHSLPEAAAPRPGLLSAVHALYGACQRRPPAVLVAESGDDFVRILALLTFRPRVILYQVLLGLGSPCLMLAMLGIAWAVKDPMKLAETGTGLILDIFIVASVLAAAAFASRVPYRMPFGWNVPVSLMGYATGAACGAMTSWLLGGNEFHVLFGAVAGTAAAVLIYYAGLLLWAAWSRWRLGRREGARVPLLGDRPIHDVIGPRLRSASDDVTNTHLFAINRSGRRLREEAPPIAASMQAEARHRSVWLWHENGPLLGSAVARYGTERLVCGYALDRVAAVEDLPVVLRAAIEVDTRVDAASFFTQTALVLPADSRLTSAEPQAVKARTWRRSYRSPYRQVLAACNAGVLKRVAIDLMPSPEFAERVLARTVVRLEDVFRRQTAIAAMGEGRLVAATGIAPMQSDDFGDLYLIGSEQNPLAFVKVRDASPTVDGVHREHWLSVPPHMATAREAVAWTFGMSERAYSPAAQS